MNLKKQLREDLLQDLGGFPTPPPLDIQVIEKRVLFTYEEWKIKYTVETEKTMPIASGRTVPAYLLIPKLDDFSPPYPAMICFHQCNWDCVLGKEAVVGKAPDRHDQQYGYELVDRGFVVLAPDSFHCGERNIPDLRKKGENKGCSGLVDPYIGRKHIAKRVYDGIRAVDVLQSLDFVDAERIGVIGHSMGSGDARLVMALDERVKACIQSSDNGTCLPLHSPRLHVGMWGTLDPPPDQLEMARQRFVEAQKIYKADGAPENLIFRTPISGHYFVDEFKLEAYARLTEYFGFTPYQGKQPEFSSVSLARVLKEVWSRACRKGNVNFIKPEISTDYEVQGDEKQLIDAFGSLVRSLEIRTLYLDPSLHIHVEEISNHYDVVCMIPCPKPVEHDAAKIPHDSRNFELIFHQHRALLRREHTDDHIIYRVSLRKAIS